MSGSSGQTGDDPATKPVDDAVADAVVHGLLVAAARRGASLATAVPAPTATPASRPVTRRRVVTAALASAAALVVAATLLVPPAARADAILEAAADAITQSSLRVYDVSLRIVGDRPGFAELDGRVFLFGGDAPRLVATLLVGPLRRPVRLGTGRQGAWLETPRGVIDATADSPVVSAMLGGFDDRLLRLDTLVARCRSQLHLEARSRDRDHWRVVARRREGTNEQPVAAEFIARKRDGVITAASIQLQGPLGGMALLSFNLVEGVEIQPGDLEPVRPE